MSFFSMLQKVLGVCCTWPLPANVRHGARALVCAAVAIGLGATLGGCSVKPKQFSSADLTRIAADNAARVDQGQEPLTGPVTLDEAIARALKYNLDYRVEEMETRLRTQQLHLAHFDMLPGVVANQLYDGRNNYSGGQSREILSPTRLGDLSLRSSTSMEREIESADLAFSWNILDFGLSYVRAKQSADRVLVAMENRRRVVRKVIEDVQIAYWRAVTASRLGGKLRALASRVEKALDGNVALLKQAESSPLDALRSERELLSIKKKIEGFDADLSVAKTQLAALMNVRPGDNFTIEVPDDLAPPPFLDMSADEMVDRALLMRSELREVGYQLRINKHEAEAALLELLPGLTLGAGPNWSSNEFLYSNSWIGWSAKASWNLMKVFSYPAREAEINARDNLLEARSLAVAMAIMTQVYASRARLTHARQRFKTSARQYRVQTDILSKIRLGFSSGSESEQSVIREEMDTLVSRIEYDLAYIELCSAYANALSAIGDDLIGQGQVETMPLAEIKSRLRGSMVAAQAS